MPRKKQTPDPALLIRIAELYYEHDKRLSEIAELTSKPFKTIRPLLREARNQGLVRIEIRRPLMTDLAEELIRRYPRLIKVEVVDEPGDEEKDYLRLLRIWGQLAARYLDELLDRTSGQLRVGVSGGETLLEFASNVPLRNRENLEIYTTALVGHGVMAPKRAHVIPFVNATVLWANSGRYPGQCRYATVPPYEIDVQAALKAPDPLAAINSQIRKEKKMLSTHRDIGIVHRQMGDVDVVFPGLGAIVERNTDDWKNRLTMTAVLPTILQQNSSLVDSLLAQKVIGEMSYCLFDENGQSKPEWEFFLTAGGIKFFQRMVKKRKPVVVMAGRHKEAAIRAALKGELFSVWFTDKKTADAVLRSAKN